MSYRCSEPNIWHLCIFYSSIVLIENNFLNLIFLVCALKCIWYLKYITNIFVWNARLFLMISTLLCYLLGKFSTLKISVDELILIYDLLIRLIQKKCNDLVHHCTVSTQAIICIRYNFRGICYGGANSCKQQPNLAQFKVAMR